MICGGDILSWIGLAGFICTIVVFICAKNSSFDRSLLRALDIFQLCVAFIIEPITLIISVPVYFTAILAFGQLSSELDSSTGSTLVATLAFGCCCGCILPILHIIFALKAHSRVSKAANQATGGVVIATMPIQAPVVAAQAPVVVAQAPVVAAQAPVVAQASPCSAQELQMLTTFCNRMGIPTNGKTPDQIANEVLACAAPNILAQIPANYTPIQRAVFVATKAGSI